MKFYFISQVYPPDPAAVGQYFEDAAITLAARGHDVVVLTADRDYDDPSILYDASSRHPKIKVVRLWRTSFGKKTLLHRLLGQASYLFQCFCWLLFKPRPDGVVLTTIPATTGAMFLPLQWIKRFRYLYWVMDINPDQAIALGAFSERSIFARALGWVNRKLTLGAQKVVCLDNEMTEKLKVSREIEVIPPWPLENDLQPLTDDEVNHFTLEHNLSENLVFMYSGNHSLVHPLDTLLDAIVRSDLSPRTVFAFVGGGRGKSKVEALLSESSAIRSFPYQPLDRIRYSLSAADVHVVTMGETMRGIVHPCKLYTALAVGKPILFLGDSESVLGRVVTENRVGWCVAHGDIEEMVCVLARIETMSPEELASMGARASVLSKEVFSRDKLCEEFCNIVEELGGDSSHVNELQEDTKL